MAAPTSAGLLMFRRAPGLQVFLIHPGGPFFLNRDEGVWSVPKGLVEAGEDLLACAAREFGEEVGLAPEPPARRGEFLPLGSVRQKGGKTVHVWAFEADPGLEVRLRSNTFRMQWPPGSGRVRSWPEADRGEFFGLAEARRKVLPAQEELLDRLLAALHLAG